MPSPSPPLALLPPYRSPRASPRCQTLSLCVFPPQNGPKWRPPRGSKCAPRCLVGQAGCCIHATLPPWRLACWEKVVVMLLMDGDGEYEGRGELVLLGRKVDGMPWVTNGVTPRGNRDGFLPHPPSSGKSGLSYRSTTVTTRIRGTRNTPTLPQASKQGSPHQTSVESRDLFAPRGAEQRNGRGARRTRELALHPPHAAVVGLICRG